MIKNLVKSFISIFIIIIISTTIITLLSYIGLLNGFVLKIVKIIIPIISIFISAFMLGIKSNNKGYIEGIKLAVLFNLILIFYSLISKVNPFNLKNIIFYIIIIFIAIMGSSIGINKKSA